MFYSYDMKHFMYYNVAKNVSNIVTNLALKLHPKGKRKRQFIWLTIF